MGHRDLVAVMMATEAITGTHPYADMFPMLPGPELEELAESIRANGLLNPIVITPDGLILDGRNRAAACELAGIEPHFVIHDSKDLDRFVIAQNSTRRHMSTGAHAMATARVLHAAGRRENGRWKRGSVAIYESVNSDGSWSVRLSEAGTVLDFKPDLASAVVAGDVALDAAFKEAKEAKDAQERDRNMLSQMAGTKYAGFVEDGSLTLAAAWAAYQEDTRKEREAQRQIEDGIRTTNVHMAEAVRTIATQKPAASFISDFWPHHRAYVLEGMRITPQRCRDAIAVLTAILEETNDGN
jgi:hypothetical protein